MQLQNPLISELALHCIHIFQDGWKGSFDFNQILLQLALVVVQQFGI